MHSTSQQLTSHTNDFPRSRAPRNFAVGLLALVTGLGCSMLGGARRDALEVGGATDAVVQDFTWRGDYLDVGLQTGGFDFRFLFPASPECFTLFESGAPLGFVQEGRFGRVVAGDVACPAIGVLSLRVWLDHGPIAVDETPVDPEEIQFVITDQDGEIFLAVGDFSLARSVGWADPRDAILVMPNRGQCRMINVFAAGTMEFHPGAQEPLVVVNRGQRCPVLGFTERYKRDTKKGGERS